MGNGQSAAVVEFRILGSLEVVCDGRPLALKPAKARAVLALLLLEPGRVVAADRLIDELWGDRPPASVGVSLRVLVSRLRKTLAAAGLPDAIATRSPGYALDIDRSQIDAQRFETLLARGRGELAGGDAQPAAGTLRDALALWRGPALAEMADSPAAAAEAARLDEARLLALEERIDADLACGRHTTVIAELESLVRAQPFRERLWAARMLALYRCGRQADALAAFTALRERLVEELGIEPSPDLRDLQSRVLAHDPALSLTPHGPPLVDLGRRGLRGHERDERVFELRAAGSAAAQSDEEFVRELPRDLTAPPGTAFVGRRPELDVLDGLWKAAVAGALEVALLAGEPGIGKTRLAAELAARAYADGAVALFGRCDEDLGVPYQPFAEALRAFVAACPVTELADHAGRDAGDLARLVPEVGERLLGARPAATGDAEEERDRLFGAVVSLLAGASRSRPLVVVLDDLQWAAKPTLLMLRHLLRAREPMRLLVLGTYRDTELDRAHPLAEMLADLRRDAIDVKRLRLRGLDADAVSTYFAADEGQPLQAREAALARTLHANTEGNPFFIVEVLRHLDESGLVRREHDRWVATGEIADTGLPEGIKDVIGRRLSRLSESANQALAVASVVGAAFSLAVLERVPDAAENPDRLLDAVEEALRAGLVSETAPGSYAFSHALIRQTLYAELTSTRRGRLHRRVGEAIEQLPDADSQVESLAHHFGEAALDGQFAKAADYALAAGRRALQRLAHEEAVTQLQRGLEFLDLAPTPDHARRADLLLELAQARREIGDLEGNREASLAAAEEARAIGSGERLAMAAQVYWSSAGVGVPDPTVPTLCEEALAALGDSEPALRARMLARLTHYRSVAESQGFALADQADTALALARQSGDFEALAAILGVSIRVRAGTGRVAERLPLIAELIELGRRHDDQRSVLIGLALRHDAHIELADRAACDADFDELERLSGELGTRLARHLLAVVRSMRALLEGRFAEVPALSEQAFAHGGRRPDVLQAHDSRMALLHREQGRFEEAVTAASVFAAHTGAHPLGHLRLAHLQAESGDDVAARAVSERFSADDFAAVPRDVAWPASLTHLAGVCAIRRETDDAGGLYDALRPHRERLVTYGGIICVGAADRFLGMLAATQGKFDDAEAHYVTALELEDRMKALPLAARTRYWYARALLERGAAGDRNRAASLLTACRATAEELGMAALASTARELLDAA